MCEPTVLNIWPLRPSGVQAATAIVPPGPADAHQLGGGCSCRGANIVPNVDRTRSNESSG